MDVTSVSSATNPYPTKINTSFKASLDDFSSMADAINNGDLAGAQSAYASFKTNLQNAKGLSSVVNSNSQIGKDFQALDSAFQSGDMATIQSTFQTLQKDLGQLGNQVQGHKHHPHHHHQENQVNDAANTSAASSTISINASTSGNSNQQAAPGVNINSLV